MAQPLVSVIIPAFNAEATLREAVETLLGGSFANFEVIIVDDGSIDSTAAVADALVELDPRVSLHRRKNGGVSAACNAGFALAKGEYVARLDADDIWHHTKLQRQVEAAQRNPAAAFIYCWVRYIDADGRVHWDGPQQRFPQNALCRGIYESLVGGNSSALIRTAAIREFGGYDEALASWEDLLLQLRVSAKYPIDHVPEYLVGYRVRPGSLSATPHNMLASWRVARERIEKLFPQVPAFVLRWAHGRRCAELAEGFAWLGDYPACARLLAEALRHDPHWTTRWLAHRSWRYFARRLSPPKASGPAPVFRDCAPSEQVRPSEQVLTSLEEERIATLTALDESLAQ